MTAREPRYQCPRCEDVHSEDEREPDGAGGKECPECGCPRAFIIDEGIDPPS